MGADAIADVVATGMLRRDRCVLLDIGTNTEILAKNHERILSCSAASGPAFEGAHIKFGMRAATGAIDSVQIGEGGEVDFTVIGGGKPRGITGSAVVDAIAELRRVGLLDESGRMADQDRLGRVKTDQTGRREFVLVPRSLAAGSREITLSQGDVREIQLAKAAIRAGTDILMRETGLDATDVDVLFVAGAFGFFLNPVSARAIGLYPEIETNRIGLVGNAAVAGARSLLLSRDSRNDAEAAAKTIGYVDLASHKEFGSGFLRSIRLPPL